VDLPGAAWGVSSSARYLARAVDALKSDGRDAHMVLGSSHDEAVQESVRQLGPYDFALIDGDHRYEAVRKDFEDYRAMARYVAFHDITGTEQGTKVAGYRIPVEVPRLWAELREGFEHWEFVDDGSQMGIGVIKVN
jgi:hypothetical protein